MCFIRVYPRRVLKVCDFHVLKHKCVHVYFCNIILHIDTYRYICVQTDPKLQENQVKTWPVRSLTLAWLHSTAESTHFRNFISSLSSVFMMRCTVQSTHFRFENMQGCDSHFAARNLVAVKWVFENTYSGERMIGWQCERLLNSYSRSYTMTSPTEIACPWKMEGWKTFQRGWCRWFWFQRFHLLSWESTPPYWLGDWRRPVLTSAVRRTTRWCPCIFPQEASWRFRGAKWQVHSSSWGLQSIEYRHAIQYPLISNQLLSFKQFFSVWFLGIHRMSLIESPDLTASGFS